MAAPSIVDVAPGSSASTWAAIRSVPRLTSRSLSAARPRSPAVASPDARRSWSRASPDARSATWALPLSTGSEPPAPPSCPARSAPEDRAAVADVTAASAPAAICARLSAPAARMSPAWVATAVLTRSFSPCRHFPSRPPAAAWPARSAAAWARPPAVTWSWACRVCSSTRSTCCRAAWPIWPASAWVVSPIAAIAAPEAAPSRAVPAVPAARTAWTSARAAALRACGGSAGAGSAVTADRASAAAVWKSARAWASRSPAAPAACRASSSSGALSTSGAGGRGGRVGAATGDRSGRGGGGSGVGGACVAGRGVGCRGSGGVGAAVRCGDGPPSSRPVTAVLPARRWRRCQWEAGRRAAGGRSASVCGVGRSARVERMIPPVTTDACRVPARPRPVHDSVKSTRVDAYRNHAVSAGERGAPSRRFPARPVVAGRRGARGRVLDVAVRSRGHGLSKAVVPDSRTAARRMCFAGGLPSGTRRTTASTAVTGGGVTARSARGASVAFGRIPISRCGW